MSTYVPVRNGYFVYNCSARHPLLQAQEKGTTLIDEDGLFSLVAAAPEAAPAAASAATKPSELRPVPAGNFYGGKASTGSTDLARKAALASSSLAASGELRSFRLYRVTVVADMGLGILSIC